MILQSAKASVTIVAHDCTGNKQTAPVFGHIDSKADGFTTALIGGPDLRIAIILPLGARMVVQMPETA